MPEPGNSQAWNRYSYVLNNSIIYYDSDGHHPIVAALLVVAKVITTAIDWGITGKDIIDYSEIAFDSSQPLERRLTAATNIGFAVAMEVAEPDEEYSPVGLPIDDIIRYSDALDDLLIRVVPEDQVGTSQPFKTRTGEDGLSVFTGVSP